MVSDVDRLRAEVGEVLVRYATGIDSRDWARLRTCFTDDCDADYGEIGHWRGGDELSRWMADTHDPVGPTLHRITNITVGPVADDGRVETRCHVHAVVVMPDRSAAVHAYGWYDDTFEPSAEGWRIARRRYESTFIELHPSA